MNSFGWCGCSLVFVVLDCWLDVCGIVLVITCLFPFWVCVCIGLLCVLCSYYFEGVALLGMDDCCWAVSAVGVLFLYFGFIVY